MWDEDPRFQAAAYYALKVTFSFGVVLLLVLDVIFEVPLLDALTPLIIGAGAILLYGLIVWSVGMLLKFLLRLWKKQPAKD